MTTALRRFPHWPRALILAAMAAAMAAIFALDTLTDYAVAAAVFHTAIILVAVRWFSPRVVIGLTALCIVLTLASFALTPAGAYRTGLINMVISILAIAITAYLGLKMVAAQNAAHEARTQLMRITQTTSLGQLTASIAHEVNQPLAAIVTSGNACQRWLAQDPPNLAKAGQALERILGDAQRVVGDAGIVLDDQFHLLAAGRVAAHIDEGLDGRADLAPVRLEGAGQRHDHADLDRFLRHREGRAGKQRPDGKCSDKKFPYAHVLLLKRGDVYAETGGGLRIAAFLSPTPR